MPEVNQPSPVTIGEAPRSTRQQSRNFILSVLGGLAVVLAAIAAGPSSSYAQEAAGPYGMQFFVTPHLWLAGIDATTKTPLPRAPEVNSSVGPFQLLGDLNGAPFMGAFEVRQGPLGFLGDVLHVPVGTNITTHMCFSRAATRH